MGNTRGRRRQRCCCRRRWHSTGDLPETRPRDVLSPGVQPGLLGQSPEWSAHTPEEELTPGQDPGEDSITYFTRKCQTVGQWKQGLRAADGAGTTPTAPLLQGGAPPTLTDQVFWLFIFFPFLLQLNFTLTLPGTLLLNQGPCFPEATATSGSLYTSQESGSLLS